MSNFNFYNFLEENGYQKRLSGKQKELLSVPTTRRKYREYLELSDGPKGQNNHRSITKDRNSI